MTKFTSLLVGAICLREKQTKTFQIKKKILKPPGNRYVREQSDIRPLTLSAIQL